MRWLAQDREHVPRGLGLGRQHSLQGHQAPGLAFRRHAQPAGVRWPAKIKPDAAARAQFHHVNDVVPTIYEIIGITPPRMVRHRSGPDRWREFRLFVRRARNQGPIAHPVFRDHGSRAIYHDGWLACAIGPRLPWVPGLPPGIREWTPDKDAVKLPPGAGLEPSQRPCRQDAGKAGPDEGNLPDRGSEK